MRTTLKLVAVIGWLLLGPRLQAAEWLIDFDAGSAPTQYADEQGRAAGIYPAIVRAALLSLDIPFQLQARPFKRLLADVQAGTSGAGAFIRTPERLAMCDYSRDYFAERLLVLHLKGKPQRFASLADLQQRNIGVIRGWSYGAAFDAARAARQFRVEEVETDMQNLGKLVAGRLDVAIVTEVAWRILQADPRHSQIEAFPTPLATFGIALAFNKSSQSQALLERFDQAIVQLQQKREIQRIVAEEIERARDLQLRSVATINRGSNEN